MRAARTPSLRIVQLIDTSGENAAPTGSAGEPFSPPVLLFGIMFFLPGQQFKDTKEKDFRLS
ncbi:hypothetical protein J2125_001895 [Erwinia toletana]|uniref:Uncharacterized protein n=1 Tax=Winslowiella toletana TaxID=92490 RepID=A0ABS4P9S5_9GAMM|nr:hypothetical protein [Winslowiella toletana]